MLCTRRWNLSWTRSGQLRYDSIQAVLDSVEFNVVRDIRLSKRLLCLCKLENPHRDRALCFVASVTGLHITMIYDELSSAGPRVWVHSTIPQANY